MIATPRLMYRRGDRRRGRFIRGSRIFSYSSRLDCVAVARPIGSAALSEETEMSVLDDYLVDSKLSLLDKTRIQAQVLVPVLKALRAGLGREKADAIVKEA